MVRLLVAACAFVLVACGTGPLGVQVAGPPSAQSVAANDSDFPGLQKCPESGSYESYLKAEQTKSPGQYQTDKTMWDDLKKAGANDSYVVVYADKTSGCGHFGVGMPASPVGKIVYVYAIRFKDSSSASASYKSTSKGFHLSDTEVSQLKAAGATVKEGSATGLGASSVVITIDVEGASLYIAFWQNNSFEVAMVTFNAGSNSAQAATKINGRIH